MICTNCNNTHVDCTEYMNLLTPDASKAWLAMVTKQSNEGQNVFYVDVCSECYQPTGWLKYVTDAPVAYDGFGTRTIDKITLSYFPGRDFRVVLVDPKNENWQQARYDSGMKFSTTLARAQE